MVSYFKTSVKISIIRRNS